MKRFRAFHAVVERQGDAIRFHPTLLELAAHYRFDPRPVAEARGNEKGRVERAIRYARDSFFAARTWTDVDDLNAQAMAWCEGQAAERACPEDRSISVREAFAQEQPKLIALPDNPFPTDEREAVSAGKTPYVRFEGNDYSIPCIHVRRTLSVVTSPAEVRILDGTEVIARHPRRYDKGQQVEDPAHIAALTARKRQARQHRGADRLTRAAPASRTLLVAAAERGDNLGSITAALLRLIERYGATELEAAIGEALAREVPHPNAVRLALERLREQRDQPPPLPIALCRRTSGCAIWWSPPTSSTTTTSCKRTRRMTMSNPAMDDPLMARARALKLNGLLAHWEEIEETGWIVPLIQWEEEERARRSLQRRLGNARLGRFRSLADFDWDWPKRCDREAIDELMEPLAKFTKPSNFLADGGQRERSV